MLRLNRFTFLAPDSVAEAHALARQYAADGVVMAGGTDVLVNIKHRLYTPRFVIGIRRLPELRTVHWGMNGWLNLGAGVTLVRIESDPRIRAEYPALVEAARLVSTPQVRAVGTVGGNICLDVRCNYYNQSYEWRKGVGFCMKKDSPICRVAPGGDRCWAVASADTVPVLIALRADVSVLGTEGVRRFPLEQLYADDGLRPQRLLPGEIVTAVHIPPCLDYVTTYRKFRIRQSFDFPLVGVSASLQVSPDGIVSDCRIVLTAVATRPERGASAEAILIGRRLDQEAMAAAGQAMFKQAKPMDNTAGTIFHRKRMARVLLERSLAEIASARIPSSFGV